MRKLALIILCALIAVPALSQPSDWIPIEKPGGGTGWWLDPDNLPAASSTVAGVATKPANVVTVCSAGCDFTGVKDAVDLASSRGDRDHIVVYGGVYTELAFTVGQNDILDLRTNPMSWRVANVQISKDTSITAGTFITLSAGATIQGGIIHDGGTPTAATAAIELAYDSASIEDVTVSVFRGSGADGYRSCGVLANDRALIRGGTFIARAAGSSKTVGICLDSTKDATVIGSFFLGDATTGKAAIEIGAASNVRLSGLAFDGWTDDLLETASPASLLYLDGATTSVPGKVPGTSDGGAAIPVQAGAIPTCDAAYGVGLTVDQTGDLCLCDGSSWSVVSGGGACA